MEDFGKWIFRGIGILLVICFIAGLFSGERDSSPKEERIEYATDGWVTKYLTSKIDSFNDYIPTPYKSRASRYRVAFYRNGKPVADSLVTDYYLDTGEKIEEKHLISESPDVIVGQLTSYYKGRVSSTVNYVSGKKEGEYIGYNESMRVTFRGNYTNGVLQGKVYRYLDNGKPNSVETYVDGKVNGYCEFYDENGNLAVKGNFRQVENKEEADLSKGKLGIRIVPYSGEYISYYPNGRVKAKGQYQNMKEVGIWYYYDEKGNLSTKDFTPKTQQTNTYQQPQRNRDDSAYSRGYNRGWDAGYEDAVNGAGFQASYNPNGGGSYLSGYESGYQDGWDNGRAERQ